MVPPTGELPEGMPAAPDAKTWLGLYRDHGRVMDTVFSWAFGDKLQGAQASTLASLWRGFVRDFAAASKADQAAVVGLVPAEALGEYASMFAPVEFPPSEGVLRKMLEGRPLKLGESRDEDDAVTGRLVALPEVEFLLRVVLPCAVLYQQCPAKLFHRARAGRKGDDLEDLVDLLRLDKSVLGDKLILQRWHDVMHGPNKGRQSVLLRAMRGETGGSSARKKSKELAAGFISQLGIAFGCEVTAAEIRELFDRIARIRTGHVDAHLPTAEALTKAIQRNRNFPWIPKLPPDKSSS